MTDQRKKDIITSNGLPAPQAHNGNHKRSGFFRSK
jgi:hypothetical protein